MANLFAEFILVSIEYHTLPFIARYKVKKAIPIIKSPGEPGLALIVAEIGRFLDHFLAYMSVYSQHNQVIVANVIDHFRQPFETAPS